MPWGPRCRQCGKNFSVTDYRYRCPNCVNASFTPQHTFEDYTATRTHTDDRTAWFIVMRSIKLLHGGMRAYVAKGGLL